MVAIIMIGVICKDNDKAVVEEFFQLFKTPWEFYDARQRYDIILSTDDVVDEVEAKLLIVYGCDERRIDQMYGLSRQAHTGDQRLQCERRDVPIYKRLVTFSGEQVQEAQASPSVVKINENEPRRRIIRVGYDLFDEVSYLLSVGQPIQNASIPTLDLHIEMLRDWILNSGIPLVEIPPVPPGYDFIACLTHDVDFVKVNNHKYNRTMLGFVYRALVGSLFRAIKGNIPWTRLWKNVKAVISLPFVYLGLSKDFWLQFENYLEIEKGLGSTYFLIPFKGRAGDKVPEPCPERRATHYDIGDVQHWANRIVEEGHEVGVHGIDAWHDAMKGRRERDAIAGVVGTDEIGVRMHWLCFDEASPQQLDDAGFSYDSTFGYNETIGFRAGTSQAFRPPGVEQLLEIPLHIQDVALFYPSFMNMTERQAEESCREVIDSVRRHSGVLTLLWHLRSLAPERLWGDFYVRLLDDLKKNCVWFASAGQVTEWFRLRRAISFTHQCIRDNEVVVGLESSEELSDARFILRLHQPFSQQTDRIRKEENYIEKQWTGEDCVTIQISEHSEIPAYGT